MGQQAPLTEACLGQAALVMVACCPPSSVCALSMCKAAFFLLQAGFLAAALPGNVPPHAAAYRVHTLVTLGTPHTSAEPVTRRNIDYVNEHYNAMDGVR